MSGYWVKSEGVLVEGRRTVEAEHWCSQCGSNNSA